MLNAGESNVKGVLAAKTLWNAYNDALRSESLQAMAQEKTQIASSSWFSRL